LFQRVALLPSYPDALFDIGPLSRTASAEVTDIHDRRSAQLACYKLGRISSDDADGIHRVLPGGFRQGALSEKKRFDGVIG
jgi:hypothetical protein